MTIRADEIDNVVMPMLAEARIPGAAIAVVADGRLEYARGYGLRDIAAGLPMLSNTRYPIASTTKSMTATLIGMLVDQKLLSLDDRVQQYLPQFRLRDSARTPLVTLRDLLSMRTGLPRHDWLWVENEFPRSDLARRFAELELTDDFRTRFQYNNLTVTLAANVAEVVTGQRWEDLIRAHIFEPLEMCDTDFGERSADVTRSYHDDRQGSLIPTTPLLSQLTGPSGGSVHSTVLDMAKWVTFNLGDGIRNGRRLLHADTLSALRAPHIPIGDGLSGFDPDANYGLCWEVHRYQGQPSFGNGGHTNDVNSHVWLVPRHNLGFVCFTNFGGPRLAKLINEHLFDHITGGSPRRSTQQRLEEYAKRVADCGSRPKQLKDTTPSRPLADYTGCYGHAAYGDFKISNDVDRLWLTRGRITVALAHCHYDVWSPISGDDHAPDGRHPFEPSTRYRFEANDDGHIEEMVVRLDPALEPIRFRRKE